MSTSPCLVLENTSPLVSVIVPAYNAEAFIESTLHSALNQTYTNIEVLVVDDGSQDRTADIVRAIASEDDRVVLLCQENQGVAAARNLAIEHARGEYIAPLDADDLWFPEKLERQVACMEQGGPGMGLIYSWWVMIDEDNEPLQASSKWDLAGDVFEALIFVNFIGNASVPLMRAACIKQVGGYSTQLKAKGGQGCEDWELALRLAAAYKVGLAPGYLCGYRRVRDSMSMDCRSMGQSHQLIIDGLQRSHPHISATLLNWSGSTFYSYLGRLSYRSENYAAAKHWFFKALTVDPLLVLSLPFLKLCVRSLLRSHEGSLLTRALQRHTTRRRGKRPNTRPPSLKDLKSRTGAYPRSWTWKSGHPYDWIFWYRWRKVKAQIRTTDTGVKAASTSYERDYQAQSIG